MRATQEFLRAQLSDAVSAAAAEGGRTAAAVRRRARRDPLRRGAAGARRRGRRLLFPPRGRAQEGEKSQLVQERMIPDQRDSQRARVPRRRALGAGRRASPSSGSRISAATPNASRRRRADVARPLGRQAAAAAARAHRREAGEGRRVADARRRAAARARGGLPSWDTRAARLREVGLMRAAAGSTRVRSRRCGPPTASRQRGIALIAVLWLTVLLTVIASGFAYSMRGEALAARNTMSLAQARAAADGAVERMAFELPRARGSPDALDRRRPAAPWKDGEIAVTATAVDEGARIDLNMRARAAAQGAAAERRRTRSGDGAAPGRRDHRLARRRRPARPNGAEAAGLPCRGARSTCRPTPRSKPSASCSACSA